MRVTARVPDVGQRVVVNPVLFPKRDFMAILNYLVKLVTRTFMPELSRNMESEGTFDFTDPQSTQGAVDLSRFIQVEDNGSDVTIISFAGMAVLFAGMPQFEFRNMLKEDRNNYNLIFLRDPYGTGYFRQHNGGGNGADF